MLKVMTLNCNYYVDKHGPWEARSRLIADVIRTADPDIIALQAVRREPGVGDGRDQAEQLAAMAPGYDFVVFRTAMEHPGGISDGSAVISRIEMAAAEHVVLSLLTRSEDQNSRILVHTRYDLPQGPFHVFNAHFSWVEEQAADNVDEALTFLRIFSGAGLLVGDLNQAPRLSFGHRLADAGWVDVWEKVRVGEPGYTFESDNPSIRIDYAWANPTLLPYVDDIEVIGRAQDQGGYRVSDHHGLLITLGLNTP